MNKAYAVQLSNGWYCLDDIYFHQCNRHLPTLKPLVAEFRALASRQRRAIDRQAKIRRFQLSLQEINRLKGIWNVVQLPDEQMIEVLNQAELFTLIDPAKPDGLLLKGVPGTGRTMLARTLVETTRCNFIPVKLSDVKRPVSDRALKKYRGYGRRRAKRARRLCFWTNASEFSANADRWRWTRLPAT
jgi:hypothetical protein